METMEPDNIRIVWIGGAKIRFLIDDTSTDDLFLREEIDPVYSTLPNTDTIETFLQHLINYFNNGAVYAIPFDDHEDNVSYRCNSDTYLFLVERWTDYVKNKESKAEQWP